MFGDFFSERETQLLVGFGLAFICGLIIGGERELKGKPAGISTQTLVIAASMMFAYISHTVGAGDGTRIAAQIVSGVGFLGAGIILKSKADNDVTNVTTAASIWYAAAIGMAIGFEYYFIAIIATLYASIVARIPNLPVRGEKKLLKRAKQKLK